MYSLNMQTIRNPVFLLLQLRAVEGDLSSFKAEASKAIGDVQRALAGTQKQRADLETQLASLKCVLPACGNAACSTGG